MLGWGVGGGGLETVFSLWFGELYSVVVCGVSPWLLKYINWVMFATSNLCKSVKSVSKK